jgi:predicted nuclease of predicted toxin-antitoxin system
MNNKIKVFLFALCDNANVLTKLSTNINTYSTNYESIIVCKKPHPFNYKLKHDYDIKFDKQPNILDYLKESEIIIIGDDIEFLKFKIIIKNTFNLSWIKINNILKNKKICLYFCGSFFRQNHKNYFNRKTYNFNFLYNPDLFNLCIQNSNQNFIMIQGSPYKIPYDIEDIIKAKNNSSKIIITHSPTSIHIKLTNTIEYAIKLLLDKYDFIEYQRIGGEGKIIDNELLLETKKRSHIYIDQFNKINGFGVSALESMAYGNITLCCLTHVNNNFKNCNSEFIRNLNIPIISLDHNTDNHIQHIFHTLEKLCLLERKELINKCIESYKFIQNKLNPETFIQYFENDILNKFI